MQTAAEAACLQVLPLHSRMVSREVQTFARCHGLEKKSFGGDGGLWEARRQDTGRAAGEFYRQKEQEASAILAAAA